MTSGVKHFLVHSDDDDKSDKLFVFAMDQMLVRMQNANTLFTDRTFYAHCNINKYILKAMEKRSRTSLIQPDYGVVL